MMFPLGYDLGIPTLSYVVEEAKGKRQEKAQIIVSSDEYFKEIVHDSGISRKINSLEYPLDMELQLCTRYYWRVKVWSEAGEFAESETAWFETPKGESWTGVWISPKADKKLQMTISKEIRVHGALSKVRMYMVGLGVYELYVNGKKQGEEYLLPGLHAYDSWIQYQTFELDLKSGSNMIEIMLGDGWYKGRFGLTKHEENYGDRLACIGDLVLWYEDGHIETIGTDTTWTARKSRVVESGIYPGEFVDDTQGEERIYETEEILLGTDQLKPRLSPPIKAHEHLKPIEVIYTPKGETVLDFGQNMVGWISFINRQAYGAKLYFQFGEIMQEGNFYRDNLRSAKAEFTYISNGEVKEIRPHFTFYGFRYVKVEGWAGPLDPEDFTGVVIYSEMEDLGFIETSDPFVNKLFQNAKWGQKGNFLDVPTDCPQRDERLGWTGDAQIFSGTACFNMDTYAFFRKYGYDILCEQKKMNGSVPDVVPRVNYDCNASTGWGEAATVIPWNVYLHYGDKSILACQYESMKAWVEYMKDQDERYGAKRLWQSGFHYADWLALDGPVEGGVYGATDPFLISSSYYYHSTEILSKAAAVLGFKEEESKYGKLAEEIKSAFQKEYFSETGRLSVDTMTAYVIVLYMNLVPNKAYERTCQGLLNKLSANQYRLCTGFVGTPYLCRVLSEHHMNEISYRLLMEKGYPGWLYEVQMGATTIWERWNSVLPDGKISGTEMNSLNHYAYGSIVEWMYRYMIGINPVEEKPGFKRAVIAPKPDYQLEWAKSEFKSASGNYRVKWELKKNKLEIVVNVPFDCEAELWLPNADKMNVRVLGEAVCELKQMGEMTVVNLVAGEYVFSYVPTKPYRKIYSIDLPIEELLENSQVRDILQKNSPRLMEHIPFQQETPILRAILNSPFVQMPYEEQEELDRKLRAVK